MQSPIEGQIIHMMRNILLFIGGFVVRTLEEINQDEMMHHIAFHNASNTYPIRAVTVGMIATPVLKAIIGNIARQGLGIVSNKRIIPVGRVQIPEIVILRIMVDFIIFVPAQTREII